MTKLIAKTRIPHLGKTIQPGDEFEVRSVNTRRVLIACGKAVLATSTPTPVETEPVEKVERTTPLVVETEKVKRKRSRKYARRDMTAEDV
jgi:hypothetical protein